MTCELMVRRTNGEMFKSLSSETVKTPMPTLEECLRTETN
jgi:hypothetical protein